MSDSDDAPSTEGSQAPRDFFLLPVPPPLPRPPVSLGPLQEAKRPEVFLLPQSGDEVVSFSSAFICDACRAVRGPRDISTEIESYFCPACLDAMPQTEALACNCRCTKCFDCPRCFVTLGVLREQRNPSREVPDDANSGAAALKAAEALVESRSGAMTDSSVGPQRCDSLLSISSSEEEEAASGVKSATDFPMSATPQRANSRKQSLTTLSTLSAGRKSEKFEYSFACPYCKWSSKPLDMVSFASGLLPAAGTADDRGGRIRRCFGPLFDLLQNTSRERERARQLQARVKHKAVALLFAAVAASGSLTGSSAGLNRPQRDKSWRIADVEDLLREKKYSAVSANIWESFPRDVPQPPQHVSLGELLAGKHLADREVISELDWSRKLQQDLLRGGCDPGGDGEEETEEMLTDEERKALEPLNADQLLLDRGSPDLPPALPQAVKEYWQKSGRQKTGANAVEGDFVTLDQRLRNPNLLMAAASSAMLLRPVRKRLLTRQSKRCRDCQKFVVKTQVSPIAVPPLRLNAAAALLLPLMFPRIKENAMPRDGVVDVEIGIMNPADVPMRVHFRLKHEEVKEEEEGEIRSPKVDTDEPGKERSLQHAERREEEHEGKADNKLTGLAKDNVRGQGNRACGGRTGGTSEPQSAEEGCTSPVGVNLDGDVCLVRKNWQTLELLTPDFEIELDAYDELLEEFRESDEHPRPSDNAAIVLARRGNSALLRLRVRAQPWALQQVACCCMTLDVTPADDDSTVRACYILCLGRVEDAGGEDIRRRESL